MTAPSFEINFISVDGDTDALAHTYHGKYLKSMFVAHMLPSPNLFTLILTAAVVRSSQHSLADGESSCRVALPGQVWFNSRGFVIESRLLQHYNINTFLSAQNGFQALLVSNFDSIEFSSPKLYSRCAVGFPVRCQVSQSALSGQEGNPGKVSAISEA